VNADEARHVAFGVLTSVVLPGVDHAGSRTGKSSCSRTSEQTRSTTRDLERLGVDRAVVPSLLEASSKVDHRLFSGFRTDSSPSSSRVRKLGLLGATTITSAK
jgi:hypothetical protein